ncbi:hypothetical protein PybrP1_010172, partial [[Pythium] brassicae (nom. inval.)]
MTANTRSAAHSLAASQPPVARGFNRRAHHAATYCVEVAPNATTVCPQARSLPSLADVLVLAVAEPVGETRKATSGVCYVAIASLDAEYRSEKTLEALESGSSVSGTAGSISVSVGSSGAAGKASVYVAAPEAFVEPCAHEHLRAAAADGSVATHDHFLREFTAVGHRVATFHAPGDEQFGKHIASHETFCLEAQPASAVFNSERRGERFPLPRALTTSAVADTNAAYPQAEVRNERERVLLAICDSAKLPSEVVRWLAPVCPLLGLERPLFFRMTPPPPRPGRASTSGHGDGSPRQGGMDEDERDQCIHDLDDLEQALGTELPEVLRSLLKKQSGGIWFDEYK